MVILIVSPPLPPSPMLSRMDRPAGALTVYQCRGAARSATICLYTACGAAARRSFWSSAYLVSSNVEWSEYSATYPDVGSKIDWLCESKRASAASVDSSVPKACTNSSRPGKGDFGENLERWLVFWALGGECLCQGPYNKTHFFLLPILEGIAFQIMWRCARGRGRALSGLFLRGFLFGARPTQCATISTTYRALAVNCICVTIGIRKGLVTVLSGKRKNSYGN